MTKVVSLVLKAKKKETSRTGLGEMKSSSGAKRKQESPKTVTLTSKGYERHRVKHDYHDYARVMEVSSHVEMEIAAKASGGVNNPFPTILHKMLSESEAMRFSHLISWQSHGRSFLIHKPREFVRDVVPRYFKHSKLSSFQRQLSLYGFVRLTNEGPDKGAYYHELFLRGRPFLCSKIQRTRVKGTWVRTSSSPESEPDFFSMDPVVDMEGSAVTSSPSAKPPQHSGLENQRTGTPPNFVSPKSSPALQGERDAGGEFQQTIQLDRFQLDATSDQACHDVPLNKSGTLSTAFGIHPPPTLPALVLSRNGPSFSGDQVTQGSLNTLSHQQVQALTGHIVLPNAKDFNQSWNQKWFARDIPSLTMLGKALSHSEGVDDEDDELQTFLCDVDLGFELDMVEEILQSSAF